MPPPSRSTFSTPLRFQSHHSTRSSTSYPLARIRASIPRRRRAIRSPGGVDSVASTPPGGSCGTLGRLEPPTKWPTDLIDSYLPSPLLLSRLFLPSSRSWLSYVDHHRHRHRRHHHRRRHRHRRRAVPCRAVPCLPVLQLRDPPIASPTRFFSASLRDTRSNGHQKMLRRCSRNIVYFVSFCRVRPSRDVFFHFTI